MFAELVIERVRRRLIATGGQRAWEALEALERLSPPEMAVLVQQEAQG